MDRTGRRRRVATALGALFAALLTSSLAIVVAGLLGASPMPLPGLPTNGDPNQPRGAPSSAAPGTRRAPAQPESGATRTAVPAPVASTTPVPATTATTPRGNRPTHAGNPHPSKSK